MPGSADSLPNSGRHEMSFAAAELTAKKPSPVSGHGDGFCFRSTVSMAGKDGPMVRPIG